MGFGAMKIVDGLHPGRARGVVFAARRRLRDDEQPLVGWRSLSWRRCASPFLPQAYAAFRRLAAHLMAAGGVSTARMAAATLGRLAPLNI